MQAGRDGEQANRHKKAKAEEAAKTLQNQFQSRPNRERPSSTEKMWETDQKAVR